MTNIVLVVMDTARADVVDILNDDSPMPELRDIASGGTVYSSSRSTAPWTLPSHGTLFSGQYPSVHQAHAGRKIFDYSPTASSILQNHGYTTVAISNNTWISEEFGFGRGFDEFLTTWQLFQDGGDFGDVAQTQDGYVNQLRGILRKFRGNPVKNLANLVYGQFFRKRTDDGAKRTNEFVAENLDSWLADEPLFLFVNYLEPHLEYRPPDKFAKDRLPPDVTLEEAEEVNQDAWRYIAGEVEMTDRDFAILRSLYEAELAYLDERLSELYDLFVDAGVAEETTFIITGDHGENIGEHGLMDHQYSLHETLLHIPLIIDGPEFRDGGIVDRPTQLIDIAPTIFDIADASSPESLPGRSLTDPDQIPPDRPMFAEYLAPQPGIQTLRDRYDCRNDVGRYDRRLRAIVREDWKLIRGSDGSEWLFQLSEDETESRNLIGEDSEQLKTLRQDLGSWADEHPSIETRDTSMSESTEQRLEDLGYLQ